MFEVMKSISKTKFSHYFLMIRFEDPILIFCILVHNNTWYRDKNQFKQHFATMFRHLI